MSIKLIYDHPEFQSLCVKHWMNESEPMFSVSCGSSFSEFYSEFNAKNFFKSEDKLEIEKFMSRVNCNWFILLLKDLASGKPMSSDQIIEVSTREQNN
ncbi:hypothetical protein KO489_01440 [Reinekea forsetii]|nr:hypothetical protein [Reinekea forsetii]